MPTPWRSRLRAGAIAGWTVYTILAAVSAAQTVSPLIDENIVKNPGKTAKGKIDYFNDSLQPLNVVLEAKSFSVSERGAVSYYPLDNTIRLKLSRMTFRIPPRQRYTVFYEASADKTPSWCVVYATFSGFREKTAQGLRLQIQLPHTIYLLPKQVIQRKDITVLASEYVASDKKVVVRVHNAGDAFGRVLEVDVSGHGAYATQGGFPLFPQADRQVEIPWQDDSSPSKIVLHLRSFTLEQPVIQAGP
jgi:hypothetical protein